MIGPGVIDVNGVYPAVVLLSDVRRRIEISELRIDIDW